MGALTSRAISFEDLKYLVGIQCVHQFKLTLDFLKNISAERSQGDLLIKHYLNAKLKAIEMLDPREDKSALTTLLRVDKHDDKRERVIKTIDPKGKSLECAIHLNGDTIITYNVMTNHSSTDDLLRCVEMQNKHFTGLMLDFLERVISHKEHHEVIKKAYTTYTREIIS